MDLLPISLVPTSIDALHPIKTMSYDNVVPSFLCRDLILNVKDSNN